MKKGIFAIKHTNNKKQSKKKKKRNNKENYEEQTSINENNILNISEKEESEEYIENNEEITETVNESTSMEEEPEENIEEERISDESNENDNIETPEEEEEEMEETELNIGIGKEFKELNNIVNSTLLSVIENDFQFKYMSPVQENTIPLLLSNKDTVVQAITGSGKTLAFVVPLFQHILNQRFNNEIPNEETMKERKKNVFGIVLLPTRELAKQVYQVAVQFAQKTNFIIKLFIGGEEREEIDINDEDDSSNFINCNIAIATPGRLLDYLNSKLLNVKQLEILILDEADVILNMGFRQQLDLILSHLPKQRRTGLFSATQTSELDDLIRAGLRNPVRIVVSERSNLNNSKATAVPSQLTNYYISLPYHQKLNTLIHLLLDDNPKKVGNSVIVYFLTCACVSYFTALMKLIIQQRNKESDVSLFSLHGRMVQKRRNKEHEGFRSLCESVMNNDNKEKNKKAVLFCTDVAARGLDFPSVSTIIQFDAPVNPDQFVHRVGRTARMGKKGQSILFISPSERDYIDYLSLKKIHMKEITIKSPFKKDYINHDILENIIKKDREIFEKGEEALASFIRSYKEHQCNYIFRFQKLRYDQLFETYSVLNKPKFKEIKDVIQEQPLPFPNLDPLTIPYKDEAKEKNRQKKLKQEEERLAQKKRKKKEDELDEEGNKKKKKESLYELKQKIRNRKDIKTSKKKYIYSALEHEEVINEARLLKLLRNGKISMEEYERRSGEKDLEEEIMKQLSTKKRKQLTSKYGH
ncbi:hypothetical protein ABK040_010300 [Willaertia magna]